MDKILFKEESFKIIGICMDVHTVLGMGFKEEVYKDALEIEFKEHHIPYEREKSFAICYKGKILKRRYPADFILYGEIVLEVKAKSNIILDFVAQVINYLKMSGFKLGIIANFGKKSFEFKRIVF